MQKSMICFVQNPLVCFMQNPITAKAESAHLLHAKSDELQKAETAHLLHAKSDNCKKQKPLILLRIEIDDLLQCILANGAELWSLVDAHAAVLNATVYALRTVSGTLEDAHLGLCHLLVL